MKKLRIAVVGCGGMARFYCKRYTQIEGAELALVIDSNLSAAEKIADSLGCAFSDRFEDALAPDIDVVDISTPNFLHEFQALSAIDSDKHVILQKPLAPSIAEGEHILTAAKRTKRNVGMYMSMFNNPIMYDMKRLIAEGYLGEIEGVHCRNAHRGGLITPPGTWRGDLAKCGGGSFIQLAIHSIDAVQWLIGSEIQSVMAFSHNRMCKNIGGDDATAASCLFESGVLGTIESSYCADRSYIGVYGTKGYFLFTNDVDLEVMIDTPFKGEVIDYDTPKAQRRYPVYSTLQQYEHETPYDQSIAFVKAILEGKPAPVSVESGLRDLKIVKAVYESAATGMRMDVK